MNTQQIKTVFFVVLLAVFWAAILHAAPKKYVNDFSADLKGWSSNPDTGKGIGDAWGIKDGKLVAQKDNARHNAQMYLMNPLFKDFVITLEFTVISKDCSIVIPFRVSDKSTYHAFYLIPRSKLTFFHTFKEGKAFKSVTQKRKQFNFKENTTYMLKLLVKGNTFSTKIWKKGTKEPSANHLTINNDLINAPGKIGLSVQRGGKPVSVRAAFDNIAISDAPELLSRNLSQIKRSEALPRPVFTIPYCSVAPRIDGNMERDEWSNAAILTGFLNVKGKDYYRKQTVVYITYDREKIYFAFSSPVPKNTKKVEAWDDQILRAVAKDRDGKVYDDESIELFISSPAIYGKGNNKNYVQFIGNSLGYILDKKLGAKNWNGKWAYKNNINLDKAVWEAELAISFKDLGLGFPSPGDTWYMNFARNWKSPENAWTSYSGGYSGFFAMAHFADQKGLITQEKSYGFPLIGRPSPEIDLYALGKTPPDYNLTYSIKSGNKTYFQKEISPSFLSRGKYDIKQDLSKKIILSDLKQYISETKITEKQSGKTIFLHMVPFTLYEPIILKPFYALKSGKMGVLVDLSKMPVDPINDISSLDITVKSDGGQTIGSASYKTVPGWSFSKFVKMRPVKSGEKFLITAVFNSKDKKSYTSKNRYTIPEKPEWMVKNNPPSDFVPYPFTPVKFNNGTVEVWNRKYVFGNNSFPQAIWIGDQQVLKGPIEFNVVTESGKVDESGGKLSVTQTHKSYVEMEKKSENNDVVLKVKTRVEYDGFIEFNIEVLPKQPVLIRKIQLAVPILKKHAIFYHHNGDWGEKLFGRIKTLIAGPKQPERNYYWIGDDDKGIYWLTESFNKWQVEGGELKTGVFENKDYYLAFLTPLSKPVTVDKPMKFRFGLGATPSRPPYHKNIRGFIRYNTSPELFTKHFKWPVATEGDTMITMFLKEKMNCPPLKKNQEKIKAWIKGYRKLGIKYLIYHFIDCEVDSEAYKKLWGDWVNNMPPVLKTRKKVNAECCLNSSWSEYQAHVLDTMMRDYDADGIYFDGVMARDCNRHEAHGEKCREYNWQIFAAREHFKRMLYVARRNKGKESILWGHTSLGAPLDGLMDVCLKGENYGHPLPYDDLTPDVMRAEFGKQWGPLNIILPELTKKQMIPPTRFLGLIALHDVDAAPCWLPQETMDKFLFPMWKILEGFKTRQSEFFPYYKQKCLLDKKGKPVSFYYNAARNKYLIIIVNQSAKPAEFVLSYNPSLAPVKKGIKSVKDLLNNISLNIKGNIINVPTGAWGFKLLECDLL
jgi:hypothetical protein